MNAIKTIKSTDPRFRISDGLIVSGRAGIYISQHCPDTYKHLIEECVKHGWIQPVAYMTEREMMISGLLNDR